MCEPTRCAHGPQVSQNVIVGLTRRDYYYEFTNVFNIKK